MNFAMYPLYKLFAHPVDSARLKSRTINLNGSDNFSPKDLGLALELTLARGSYN